MYCQNVTAVEHLISLALVFIRLALSRNYPAIVSGTNKNLDYTSCVDFQSNQEEMHYFIDMPSLMLLVQT